MTAVHQVVPVLEPGAVGAHTLLARRALREAGHDSEIFTPEVHPAMGGEGALGLHEYGRSVPVRPGDRLVYQMAIGSPAADFVLARGEPLVVNHHNLTPVEFLEGWEPGAEHGVSWGRRQLAALAQRAALGIAVSRYNEADLVAAGFSNTAVVPILVDLAASDGDVDEETLAALRHGSLGGADWLFVGRLAANKAQHDVVKAFAAYRREHDSRARLHLVGGPLDGRWALALHRFVTELGLGDAVTLTGPVDPAALGAHYRAADVFVCLSEHEGFCVPLLEAWHHRVPVVAFAAAAVPETLGDAGLLLAAKDPYTVATAVRRVIVDPGLRSGLVERGSARLERFSLHRTGPAFVAAIEAVEADR